MQDSTNPSYSFPQDDSSASPLDDALSAILHRGARELLVHAVEAEVAQWIDSHAHITDDRGHRQVVRNGHAEPRTILTGVGPMEVAMPRVHDRRPEGERERFTSKILPPYLRKTKSIEELIPWLYLKGISTGDFTEALQALLGPDCKGLKASTITKMITLWQVEQQQWSQRDLSDKQYVYVWADGIHFNIRLEEDKQCILVLMGATTEGTKELIAVHDGYRESEQSWSELILDLEQRGLSQPPKLAVADGALGFWAAVRKIWPHVREQRCWVHKTANVLNTLPKRKQSRAKEQLHQIWMSDTKEHANEAFDRFIAMYEAKYSKATDCLRKDRDELMTFYDFPAEHWLHVRTTNPIESTFATVRLRHRRTKGNGSRKACLAMVYKLTEAASRRWRKLNKYERIEDVIAGKLFINGELHQAA